MPEFPGPEQLGRVGDQVELDCLLPFAEFISVPWQLLNQRPELVGC